MIVFYGGNYNDAALFISSVLVPEDILPAINE